MPSRRARRLSVVSIGVLLAAPLALVATASADPGPVRVTPPEGVTQGGFPSGQDLSADGRWIVYTGSTTSADGTTYALHLADRTSGATTRLLGGPTPIGSLSISDDGDRIAYVLGEVGDSFDGSAQVHLLDRATGTSSLVSADPGGGAGNGVSWEPEISGDGSAVAFTTLATDLVPDTEGVGSDVVVREVATGAVERISGPGATTSSASPSISADGDTVAFMTDGQWAPGDSGPDDDVVVRTRSTGALVLASRAPGTVGTDPSISADGRRVAFLVPEGGRPGAIVSGVFVAHLPTGVTVRASVDGEALLRSPGVSAALSADGRSVLFSALPAVVTHPESRAVEAYVRDLALGTTRLVSSGGQPGASYAFGTAISGTGRHVLLTYLASPEQTIWSHDLGDPPTAPFPDPEPQPDPDPDPEPTVPINIQTPTVTTAGAKGPSYALVATPGVWRGAEGLTPSYQWWRNGRAVAGATGRTYVVKPADFGAMLAVSETFTLPVGDPVWAVSAGTRAVKPGSDLTARLARNRVKAGAPVVLRVRVVHDLGVRPQGKVTVTWGRRSRAVRVDADGRMRVRLTGLRAGRHTVRVSYAGTRHVQGDKPVRLKVRVTRR